MKLENGRNDTPDAILSNGEDESAFDAWTLDELGDELGALGTAVDGSDDAVA